MAGPAFQTPLLPAPRRAAALPCQGPLVPSRQPAAAVRNPHAPPLVTAGLRGSNSLPPSARVRVIIEAPARNKRNILANNLIAAPLPVVWGLLSDYNRLSDHIPNLAMSARRTHPRNGIRVEQAGSQRIFGFEFRAGLVMDMEEVNKSGEDWREIRFGLVSSRDFREFQGVWRMENMGENKTALFYRVSIMPKGLVPVKAIEWRISEDVPGNMDAVRMECERRRRSASAELRRQAIAKATPRDV